jgi:hypothetical protein
MACYCGLGTKANQLRWGIFAVFGFISMCLFVSWADSNCGGTGASCEASFLLCVVFAISSSIPLYFMCLCAHPPVRRHRFLHPFPVPTASSKPHRVPVTFP